MKCEGYIWSSYWVVFLFTYCIEKVVFFVGIIVHQRFRICSFEVQNSSQKNSSFLQEIKHDSRS